MKIKQAEGRINASYNTIKRFIEQKPEYNEKVEGIIHVTDKGLEELEKKYGVRTEMLSDDNIHFYKNQLVFMEQQLREIQKYNDMFVRQIEMKNEEFNLKEQELYDKEKRIEELEKQIHRQELKELDLKHKLELEKNKSLWKKIFQKGE